MGEAALRQAFLISKLTDADAEARETQAWIEIALRCGYIEHDLFDELDGSCEVVVGSLVNMMNRPDSWCGPSNLTREPDILYDALNLDD